jgi:hypothetical protein
VLPFTARSGEIDGLKIHRFGSLTDPDWISAGADGSTSYHRASDPAPPNTAWEVQSASLPTRGSRAATTSQSRVSIVSIREFVPGSRAAEGV